MGVRSHHRAPDLESLLAAVLESLEEFVGFTHTILLLHDECTGKLTTLASRGCGESGVGAEVAIGDGVIGMVARNRRVMRLSTLDADLRYGRAIRRESAGGAAPGGAEIPLPGLPDAQSVIAIPLALCDRLIGVLSAESRDPMKFGEWHEAYLEISGNQIAQGIDRMLERSDDAAPPEASRARSQRPGPGASPTTRMTTRSSWTTST